MSECKSFPIFFSALLFRHLQNQSFFSNKTGRRGSLPKSDFGGRCVVEDYSFHHSTTQGISFSFNVLALSGGRVVTKVRRRVCAYARYIPTYRKHILCLFFSPNLYFCRITKKASSYYASGCMAEKCRIACCQRLGIL